VTGSAPARAAAEVKKWRLFIGSLFLGKGNGGELPENRTAMRWKNDEVKR
jgi:hypothetical protein